MNIAIVGRGNVGNHLFKALEERGKVFLIDSRNPVFPVEGMDVAIICVKDDAIAETAQRIEGKSGIMAHTSGSAGIDILKPFSNHYGVFYPLQTFTKGVSLDYDKIPFFIDGSDPETKVALSQVAGNISSKIRFCDSSQLPFLHLASVFACNFTNAIYGIAHNILENTDFRFSDLIPLIEQTLSKLEKLTPGEAQTGPASRGDFNILSKHLKMLEGKPQYQEIYRLLSEIIMNKTN